MKRRPARLRSAPTSPEGDGQGQGMLAPAPAAARSRLLVGGLLLLFAVAAAGLYVLLRDARERAAHAPPGAGPRVPVPPLSIDNPLAPCPEPAACQRRCTDGSARDCVRLGNSYQAGAAVERDEAHALTLFERACELDSGLGCSLAARMYEFAHGAVRSDERAFLLYDRGCRLDDPSACYSAALFLSAGRGTPRDEARARALFERLCQRGSQTACARVRPADGPR